MNEVHYLEFKVSHYDIATLQDASQFLEFKMERLKEQGAIEVFRAIYNSKNPIVVETHIEEWVDPSMAFTHYRLHYRLTAVQKQPVYVMPELSEVSLFTFRNHLGQVEWKCPACSIINPIEATYCGEKHERAVGCGRPRENVRN